MSRRSRERDQQAWMSIGSDVVRQIRQHARSSIKTEVCGVLVGSENSDGVEVEACIRGLNADQAGAHVTFTQDTWEHIYKVKDQQYPDQRIVGWYHSHPGFGIFLSDHDTFIHKNFFSSPRQVAWVCDPHSDEEGCFGWVNGHIERLTQLRIIDRRGGEDADIGVRAEPIIEAHDNEEPFAEQSWTDQDESRDNNLLGQWVLTILSHLSVLALGFLISWYFFPRLAILPVPVDPFTGQPIAIPEHRSDRPDMGSPQTDRPRPSAPPSQSGPADSGKAGNGQR